MTVTWEELGWERLAEGVGRCRLPVWDCTAGLIVGEDVAFVIDTGSSPEEGARVRDRAQRLAGREVTGIALTHCHFDHVFGAAAFGPVPIFAADGAQALYRDGRAELYADAVDNGLDTAAARAAADALVRPGEYVREVTALRRGAGREILLVRIGPGHTGHDLAIVVPGDPTVVFCGDLVEESGEPQAGPDAVGSRWPDALDRLLELGGADAMYVPGHGTVVDAEFVRRQRDDLAARFGVDDSTA
ncbi:MBL fold metallo-hydrolase [Nocardia grenadensis]|uniref:MBL fold metallo-hydrolase n=1 Tax=Nocardia grenadensis TaxID=931537 RepID=UPI0007A43C3C|nr:MBL fold metallo-hydrolase [Nocardia grenadensis]